MAHAQKPDFVFRRNGQVHLNRRGASVRSTGSRGVRMSGSNVGYTMFRGSVKSTGYPLHSPVFPSLPFNGSNAGYTMFRGSVKSTGYPLHSPVSPSLHFSGSNAGYTTFRGGVKSTGYPLHSPVSPSLPLPCVTVCHHILTEFYNCYTDVSGGAFYLIFGSFGVTPH